MDPKPLTPVHLVGQRYELVGLDESHVDALWDAGRDPRIWRFMARTVGSRDEMVAWVADALRGRDAGTDLPLVVRRRDDGRVVGEARFIDYLPQHRQIETAWFWLEPGEWGSGAYLETALLMLRHAFDELGLVRVQSTADARNVRACRARERYGAKLEGIMRKQKILPDGHMRDTALFSVTDDDWPRVEQRLSELIRKKYG